MPSIEENAKKWNETYPWSDLGAEWSTVWGGVEAQWYGTLFPRLHQLVPAGTILEIAPGFGRWTSFLKEWCEKLVVVDLSERCIEACRRRFKKYDHIEYYVNDGRSLSMVTDGSVDFAFSFDSLVHAEMDVVEWYIRELARKLSENGRAFLHHSNMGAFVVEGPRGWVLREDIENLHWRSTSVSANAVRNSCADAGLCVISQELINWGCQALTDALTVIAREGSTWERQTVVVENSGFMVEAFGVATWSPLYCSLGLK